MQGKKPQVLVLIPYYSPGFKAGGPIHSIRNLVAALGSEFHFRIAALDRDLGDQAPFPGIVTDQWIPLGNAEVMYLASGLRGLLRMWTLLRSVDRDTVLYLNGFFPRRVSILPAMMWRLGLSRPRSLVIAPRGEFAPGSIQFKSFRKRLYIAFSRYFKIYRDAIWQAANNSETEEIKLQFPQNASGGSSPRHSKAGMIATASDIAASILRESSGRSPKEPGQLRVVFVSRRSRVKNLSGALEILAGVSGDISFDIYGPIEDAAYWDECRALIDALPDNVHLRCFGEIEHEKVAEVFAGAELLLLPTLGESFGHVIFEALGSGCPVLISDRTPWRNLESAGVGWDVPLNDTERFRSVLQQCVDGDEEWFAALSKRAAAFASQHASDPGTIDANRKLFQSAFAWPDS